MRRMVLGLMLTVSMLAVASRPVEAQFAFGPTASFGTDSDFGLGGRVLLGLSGFQIAQRPVSFQGSFDYFLDVDCDPFDCTYFEITPALVMPFPGSASVTPFVGAGLNWAYFSFDYDDEVPGEVDDSDSEFGLALLGGIFLPIGTMNGQAEGRFNIGGGEQLVLSFSLFFGNVGGSGGAGN